MHRKREQTLRPGVPRRAALASWRLACPIAVAAALVACTPVSPGSRHGFVADHGATSLAAPVAEEAWRSQATRLAHALRDVEGLLPSPPEPSADASPTGTFVARVLNVLPDGSVVLDRQQLFAGPAAYDQARRAGVTIESPLFATNLRQERLLVRPARDAAFVVWYPGEGTLDVSPSDVAAMTALSSGEFAHLYASDGAKRASLSAWGGWVTVADGRLTSFVELNSP